MYDLDAIDRKLLTFLKADARASVTTLAGNLGVSRVTAQTRLNRLRAKGVIKRFTVELDEVLEDGIVRAITMIEVRGNQTAGVIRKLRQMPEIVSLHTTNGVWDLVAGIETSGLPEFDRLLRELRELPGIASSETSLLLDQARV